MSVEERRGCGFRKVGGLYLVGKGEAVTCDRWPLPIKPCPTCGDQSEFMRGIAKINPKALTIASRLRFRTGKTTT